MSTVVHFTQKNGNPGKATFASRALADAYARTVKNPRFEDSNVAAPAVAVQKCPEVTPEVQRAATRAFHKPNTGLYVPVSASSENEAEHMAEHFFEARVTGQSMESACADWDSRNG